MSVSVFFMLRHSENSVLKIALNILALRENENMVDSERSQREL